MIRIDERTVQFTMDEPQAWAYFNARLDRGQAILKAVESTRQKANKKGWMVSATFWTYISR